MIGNFFGNLKKPYFHVKTAVATFWTTFGNIWAAFYSNIWSHWVSRPYDLCNRINCLVGTRSLSGYVWAFHPASQV